ncbi:MAG: hypothetical protein A3G24_13570 [Betaproteobacteria bacterium RIFCSPLOWO2_12_FULL_62_13]|nr:MAG: hypothetical protein A3G24_13570 [Betaproteobacteria bacterium RIFCSPLOWO2_12_FULL_62_13]
MNESQPTSPRLRLQALLAVPDRQRTDAQWDEITQRVVVIEFESVEQAIAVHDSPGYQAALSALGDGAERDLRSLHRSSFRLDRW